MKTTRFKQWKLWKGLFFTAILSGKAVRAILQLLNKKLKLIENNIYLLCAE
jgi:hypothetical protein